MRNCVLFLIVFSIGASFAFAQRISGELRLQVNDPAGGGIRAAGSIVGEATGVDRTFETNETGRFTIRALPPGQYQLIISSEGFASRTQRIEIESELPL